MNITISGHHMELTPAIRSYVEDKLAGIHRHFDQAIDIKVLLTVEKIKQKASRQKAECNIYLKGTNLFAESQHENLYAAVDDLVHKIDRQVSKYKEKTQTHHAIPTGQMVQ